MVHCTACGQENPEPARFCLMCASPLVPAAPVLGEGERKHVTVLFADVAGSMELASRMDAEAWSLLMERFFALLREGVNRFDGRVDKFTGDGVMALFGVPVAYEDHARRACAAALALQETLVEFGADVEKQLGIPFAVRMGLNSGEVVVTTVGADLKVEYTALGHTVGLAQRMEAVALPGRVYLSAATAALVTGFFELRDLGEADLRTGPDKVSVFELVGHGPARTPLEVAAAKGFSRFVGRESELAVLCGALADAKEGQGRLLSLVGEAGIGKSRLCHEFAAYCLADGVEIHVAYGMSHARSVPFLPVLQLLRDQFGVRAGDDAPTARKRVSNAVLAVDPSLRDALPLLYGFLGIEDPQQPMPVIDPEARQRRIFETLGALRRARSATTTRVLLVEDLQWLDPGSQAFLQNLLEDLPGTRQLVVTTARPEFSAPWLHGSGSAQLPLLPLREDARAALLCDLLGPDAAADQLADLVLERAGGNPFYIEEIVQGLAEEGHLAGERGAYRSTGSVDEVHIPSTVRAVLAARVDRLPPTEKTLLQTAAVVGREFSTDVLRALCGAEDLDLPGALRTLTDAELVYRAGSGPQGARYRFKHALVEEVVYAGLLSRQRARTHAAVAAVLTEFAADRTEEQAALIARHHELGGDLLEAARWNARAAAWAGLNNPVEAVRHWRAVRELTDRVGLSPDTAPLAIESRMQLLVGLGRLGADGEAAAQFQDEIGVVYQEVNQAAEATGQPAIKVIARFALGVIREIGDAVQEGVALCAEATRLADEIGDPGLRCSARCAHAWGVFGLGRVREALRISEEMAEIVGEDRSIGRGLIVTSPYAVARMFLAHYGGYWRRVDRGLADMERAIDLLHEERDDESHFWARRNYAALADLAGADPEVAAAHARAAVQWADAAGGNWSRAFNRSGLALNCCHRGAWDEAVTVVEEALAIVRPRRLASAEQALLLATRARAQLGLGDAEAARASAEEGLAVATGAGARYYGVLARHQLARSVLADDVERAAAEVQQACADASELEVNAYLPQLWLEQARLADLAGDVLMRDERLTAAQKGFLAVGATGRAESAADWASLR